MMTNKNKRPETIADRQIKSTWFGRSLENFKKQHSLKKGVQAARTLTQARIEAFGEKDSRVGTCQCKQAGCMRYGRGKSSHC